MQKDAVRVVAANSSSARHELDLGKAMSALWRGRLWIVFAALLAGGLGWYYATAVAVPVYTAATTIVLDVREQSVVEFDSVVSGLSGDTATINTEIEVLRSAGLIEKLVERMDLTSDPEFNPTLRPEGFSVRAWAATYVPALALPERGPLSSEQILEQAIKRVQQAIEISNIRGSLVFTIEVTTEDRAKSTRIANTLAEIYILNQIEVKFAATAQATEWLSQRVADLRGEFEAAQDALQAYTARTRIVTAEEIGGLNRQIAEVRARSDEMAAEAARLADEAARIRQATAAQDWSGVLDLTDDRTLRRLLEEGLGGEALLVQRAAQLVERAEQVVLRNQAQTAALRVSLTELEAQIDAQSAGLIERQALEREVEQARVLFDYFQNRLRETAVQQGIQQADSRSLSRAMTPVAPSAPRVPLVVALAATLGALIGLGFVLGREMRSAGLRSVEDLEQLAGWPVMGELPKIKARSRRAVLSYLTAKPTSHLAEAVRNLRTSILLANPDAPPKVIMMTSSVSGEGKTTQTLALAQSFGTMGKSVLVIEADIRRQTLAAKLGFDRSRGLQSVLSQAAALSETVQQSPLLGNVDVLVGDAAALNPVDVFSSARFRALVAEARRLYDIVLIDTPPVLAVPDSRVIAPEADLVLYSVKWDATPAQLVRDGLRLLDDGQARGAGLILAQIDRKEMERYGYAGYGSYGKTYYAN